MSPCACLNAIDNDLWDVINWPSQNVAINEMHSFSKSLMCTNGACATNLSQYFVSLVIKVATEKITTKSTKILDVSLG